MKLGLLGGMVFVGHLVTFVFPEINRVTEREVYILLAEGMVAVALIYSAVAIHLIRLPRR